VIVGENITVGAYDKAIASQFLARLVRRLRLVAGPLRRLIQQRSAVRLFTIACRGMGIFGGESKILRHGIAGFTDIGEIGLGRGVALRTSLLRPVKRATPILGDDMALAAHEAEQALGVWLAGFGEWH